MSIGLYAFKVVKLRSMPDEEVFSACGRIAMTKPRLARIREYLAAHPECSGRDLVMLKGVSRRTLQALYRIEKGLGRSDSLWQSLLEDERAHRAHETAREIEQAKQEEREWSYDEY